MRLLAICLLLLTAAPVQAQFDPSTTTFGLTCETLDERRALVDSLWAELDREIVQHVESVPSQDSVYLETLSDSVGALLWDGDDQEAATDLATMLQGAPYYHPHRVRLAAWDVKHALSRWELFEEYDPGAFVRAVAGAMRDMLDLQESTTVYLNLRSQQSGQPEDEQSRRLRVGLGRFSFSLSFAISCGVAALEGSEWGSVE